MSTSKIYLKGVSKGEKEEKELTDLLGNFRITSVSPDKPFMFIEFETPEQQKKALDKLSENEVCGKKIHASPAYEKLLPPRRVSQKKDRND